MARKQRVWFEPSQVDLRCFFSHHPVFRISLIFKIMCVQNVVREKKGEVECLGQQSALVGMHRVLHTTAAQCHHGKGRALEPSWLCADSTPKEGGKGMRAG